MKKSLSTIKSTGVQPKIDSIDGGCAPEIKSDLIFTGLFRVGNIDIGKPFAWPDTQVYMKFIKLLRPISTEAEIATLALAQIGDLWLQRQQKNASGTRQTFSEIDHRVYASPTWGLLDVIGRNVHELQNGDGAETDIETQRTRAAKEIKSVVSKALDILANGCVSDQYGKQNLILMERREFPFLIIRRKKSACPILLAPTVALLTANGTLMNMIIAR